MRLDRYLHDLGLGTRKALRQGIAKGKAEVDGVVVYDSAFQVAETSHVVWQGAVLRYQKHHIILMNKPAGIITATADAVEQTVLDLLPPEYHHLRIAPVGRLDKGTTGLLLLTNDGALAHRLSRPSSKIKKVYRAWHSGELHRDAEHLFTQGLELGDFIAAPAILRRINDHCVDVILTEGKFHQVKRMIAAVGGQVTALTRVAYGPLSLTDDLPLGEWRHLTQEECQLLQNVAKGSQ